VQKELTSVKSTSKNHFWMIIGMPIHPYMKRFSFSSIGISDKNSMGQNIFKNSAERENKKIIFEKRDALCHC
jgi:hypothetical protein